MMIEEKLMRNLMRTAGIARRNVHRNGENKEAPNARGFGHILDLLSENSLSQQQIADKLGIRAQSVSEAVSVLESRGFVKRQPSETDRRKMIICITEKGAEHHREMAQHRREHAAQLFAVLSETEKTELLHLLEKVNLAFADNRETL